MNSMMLYRVIGIQLEHHILCNFKDNWELIILISRVLQLGVLGPLNLSSLLKMEE